MVMLENQSSSEADHSVNHKLTEFSQRIYHSCCGVDVVDVPDV